jgi:hypothetical protein
LLPGKYPSNIQVNPLDNLVNGEKISKCLRKITSNSSGIGAGFGAKAVSIAIVGGGASGVAVAVNLMRNATMPLSIRVLEPRGGLGLGVAYSAAFDSHLLNVPAGDMSVFHDVPAHFLKWLRGNGHPQTEPTSFVPRRSYGAYFQSVLADALFEARPELSFAHVRTCATRISKNQERSLLRPTARKLSPQTQWLSRLAIFLRRIPCRPEVPIQPPAGRPMP